MLLRVTRWPPTLPLLFNHRNRLTHEVMIYRGTINTVVVRPAEIFREAIRVNASALLISHIHPSGDPLPSQEDLHTTEQLIRASKVLDIPLLDHIIVGDGAWVSLQEQGLAFGKSGASAGLASDEGLPDRRK